MTCLQVPDEASSRPPRRSHSRLPIACLFQLIQAAVARTLVVPLEEVQAPKRCRDDAAFARQVVMYLARVVLGLRYSAIGRLCNRDHKTVAHACRAVEQRRDDPATNRLLQTLEALCQDIANGRPTRPRVRA